MISVMNTFSEFDESEAIVTATVDSVKASEELDSVKVSGSFGSMEDSEIVDSEAHDLELYDTVMVIVERPWNLRAGVKDFLDVGAWFQSAEFMVIDFDDFGNVSVSFNVNGLGEEEFYIIHRDCLKIVDGSSVLV